jgi:hypothetical protein
MSMNLEQAIELYVSRSEASKVQLLGRFCFDLTVEFRSVTAESVSEDSLRKLQGINEIQHKALAKC